MFPLLFSGLEPGTPSTPRANWQARRWALEWGGQRKNPRWTTAFPQISNRCKLINHTDSNRTHAERLGEDQRLPRASSCDREAEIRHSGQRGERVAKVGSRAIAAIIKPHTTRKQWLLSLPPARLLSPRALRLAPASPPAAPPSSSRPPPPSTPSASSRRCVRIQNNDRYRIRSVARRERLRRGCSPRARQPRPRRRSRHRRRAVILVRSGSILARHRVVVVVAPGNGPPMGPVFPADSGTGGGLCRGRTTRERPRGLNATAIEGGGQPLDPLHRSRELRYLLRDSRRLDCPVSGRTSKPCGSAVAATRLQGLGRAPRFFKSSAM
jgi:hypothetical protein